MSKASVHLAYVAAGLTKQGMADLLRRATGTTSEEQIGRVQAIVNPLLNMALSDGRKFLSDTVASTKGNKEGDKPDAVVKVRASEATQIYGALKLVKGFKIDGMGWQGAVDSARASLKKAGINSSGNKLLTPEEKAEKDIGKALQPIFAEAMLRPENAERKVAEIAADAKKAAAVLVAGAEVNARAARIVKDEGTDYAEKLIVALGNAIKVQMLQEKQAAILANKDNGTGQEHADADVKAPKRATGKGKGTGEQSTAA